MTEFLIIYKYNTDWKSYSFVDADCLKDALAKFCKSKKSATVLHVLSQS